jgi:hypothetical protein
MRIVDESSLGGQGRAGISINCFSRDIREWLPDVREGDIIVLHNLVVCDFAFYRLALTKLVRSISSTRSLPLPAGLTSSSGLLITLQPSGLTTSFLVLASRTTPLMETAIRWCLHPSYRGSKRVKIPSARPGVCSYTS